ncbi:hypothetical protein IWW39_001131 [Coemansia spiralis]|uniref:Uncharacterized protein n=1 Tax=Coemansia spiralis TaxID=417178 RepID=A0A9W8GNQ5_9FUNG|nr:hypothetical protein IWW39_001131 [Coemansia spiralis]
MVRYAPSTKEALVADPSALRIRGVVFDMDGTLATPMKEHLMKMRSDIGVPNGIRTLEYVETCLHGRARELAEKRIVDIETEAMANMRLSPGLVELLSFLHAHDIPIAIITRNNINSVNHFINNVVAKQPQEQMKLFAFNPVIDRSFKPTKPHPAAILRISRAWDIPPQQLLMVGDHLDDLLCGLRAGSVSALLRYSDNSEFEAHAHIVVDRIDELVAKLTAGFDADMTISGLDNASV